MKYIYIIAQTIVILKMLYVDHRKVTDKYYEEIEYWEKEKLEMKKMADNELQKKVDLG